MKNNDNIPPSNDKSGIDYDKLKEIEKLQKMIFNEEGNKTIKISQKSNPNIKDENIQKKLVEHGNFFHDFSEYNIRVNDVVPLYFIKHHQKDDEQFNLTSNFIPTITNINIKDTDTLEITRVHLYTDFYNKKPYPTERIVIKRNLNNNKEETLFSLFEDKMKKEITSVTQDGHLSKIVKFKLFRNPNEVLFFQNIFYYRCILETYFYYKTLNKLDAKKDFNVNNLYYHEFLKNLF